LKTVEIVERIEGEAKLNCSWENDVISDARIDFLNFRGFEFILEGKSPLDALVYTPRICGICGQAHLKATVEALEGLYKNVGEELTITNKAKLIREIGLNIEIIDSHIKWFYMFILPDIIKLQHNDLNIYEPLKGSRWIEASKTASETIKALAVLGGQWPHTSYMLPGGVVSDPTLLDLTSITNYMDYAISFFEKSLCGKDIEKYLSFDNVDDLNRLKGDLKYFTNMSFENSLHKIGKSYQHYMVLGQSTLFERGRIRQRLTNKLDLTKLKEHSEHTFEIDESKNSDKKTTWAKSVTYDNRFYETGPLARAMVSNRPFITSLHDSYKDSIFVRIMARMDELAHLLYTTKNLIKQIDISEESFIKPKISLKDIPSAKAKAVVEACRGSLYHGVEINKGKIKSYDVITPTVWNLGPEHKELKGVAQKAIIGLKSTELAKITLRSFDVCSVCTTH